MDYKIIAADASIGQIQVAYSKDGADVATFVIDVPIADGAFVTGSALEAEIQARAPVWLINRKAEVAAASGFSALLPQPIPPTAQQIEAAFTASIQKRLDDFARTRNYDSILSACTYATSAVAKFKTEGQACVNLRDATWAAAYNILANVQAGKRPMPTSIADIEADLPVAVWPA